MNEEKVKTAEEVLDYHINFYNSGVVNYMKIELSSEEKSIVISAMNDYQSRLTSLESVLEHLKAENSKMREALGWVPVSERFPDHFRPVLSRFKSGHDVWYEVVTIYTRCDGSKCFVNNEESAVTATDWREIEIAEQALKS